MQSWLPNLSIKITLKELDVVRKMYKPNKSNWQSIKTSNVFTLYEGLVLIK